MDSLFEPLEFFDSEPYLSFSSFADVAPFDETSFKPIHSSASEASNASTPSPSDPFEIFSGSDAFSPLGGDIGVFHVPSTPQAGPSKMTMLSEGYSHPHLLHRPSTSPDWSTPITPGLTAKSSVDSFSTMATGDYFLGSTKMTPFSWDEASLSLGSAGSTTSSSFSADPATPSPKRVTSTPTLGASIQRSVKAVSSMPSLQEEAMAPTPSEFFDFSATGDSTDVDLDFEALLSSLTAAPVEDSTTQFDFLWSDGSSQSQAFQTSGTLFDAFKQIDDLVVPPELSSASLPLTISPALLPLPNEMVDELSGEVMAINVNAGDASRPSPAPEVRVEMSNFLSVPMAQPVLRRCVAVSYSKRRAESLEPFLPVAWSLRAVLQTTSSPTLLSISSNLPSNLYSTTTLRLLTTRPCWAAASPLRCCNGRTPTADCNTVEIRRSTSPSKSRLRPRDSPTSLRRSSRLNPP